MVEEAEKARRQLNVRLTDEEYKELHDLAEAKGKTIKDLVWESLKATHAGPAIERAMNGTRIVEKGKPVEHSWDEVSPPVVEAVKEAAGWFGFDLDQVARALARLHIKFEDLSDADTEAIFGNYKMRNPDSWDVDRDVNAFARRLGVQQDVVFRAYNKVKVIEETDSEGNKKKKSVTVG